MLPAPAKLRASFVLLAVSGCNALLGIDPPEPTTSTTDAGCHLTATSICDDFDHDPPAANGWRVAQDDAGAVTLGGPAVSPPNAVAFSSVGGTKAVKEKLSATLSGPFHRLRCRFAIQFEQLPATNGISFARFDLHGDGDSAVILTNAGLLISPPLAPLPALPTGRWIRLAIDLDLTGHVASVSIDDGPSPTQKALPAPTVASSVDVRFGIDSAPLEPVRFRMDDVTCSTTP